MPHRPESPLTLPACRPVPPAGGLFPADARLVALARAACACKAPLRRPFLRGRWHASHIDRVAAAAVALGTAQGDIDPANLAEAGGRIAARLRQLLAAAPMVADGLNSLAEFLGGRASSHADRLAVVARSNAAQIDDQATPAAA